MSRKSEEYALDLFALAYEAKQVEEIRTELKKILALLHKETKIIEILQNPIMVIEEKKGFLEQIFSNQVNRILIDFLITLLEEGTFELLDEIEHIYDQAVKQYLEDYMGIVEGEVHSAVPLTKEQLKELTEAFKKKLDKEVRLTTFVDPSLIGGYRVNIRNKVYDDTIKLQLNQLKESLH